MVLVKVTKINILCLVDKMHVHVNVITMST